MAQPLRDFTHFVHRGPNRLIFLDMSEDKLEISYKTAGYVHGEKLANPTQGLAGLALHSLAHRDIHSFCGYLSRLARRGVTGLGAAASAVPRPLELSIQTGIRAFRAGGVIFLARILLYRRLSGVASHVHSAGAADSPGLGEFISLIQARERSWKRKRRIKFR
jgi:hypothetical protein